MKYKILMSVHDANKRNKISIVFNKQPYQPVILKNSLYIKKHSLKSKR